MSDYDDLERLMRGSSDPGDARLADLLRRLRAQGHGTPPAASEALTAFIVAAESDAVVAADPHPHAVSGPAADTDRLPVVTLGRPRERSTVRSSIRVPLGKLARLGLLAKVMLGATLVLGGATAVAATGLPSSGNDNVVTTPVSDTTSAPATPTAAPSATDDDADDAAEDANDDDATPPATATPTASAPAVDNSGPGNAEEDNSGPGNAAEQGDDNGQDEADDQGEDANDNGQAGDQGEDANDDNGAVAPTATATDNGGDQQGDDGGDQQGSDGGGGD